MSKLIGAIQSIVILNQSLLGLGSGFVPKCGSFACRVWPFLSSHGTGPTRPPMVCPAAKAVAQTHFFICSHVGNSGDDYIPTRCLQIILNDARK